MYVDVKCQTNSGIVQREGDKPDIFSTITHGAQGAPCPILPPMVRTHPQSPPRENSCSTFSSPTKFWGENSYHSMHHPWVKAPGQDTFWMVLAIDGYRS